MLNLAANFKQGLSILNIFPITAVIRQINCYSCSRRGRALNPWRLTLKCPNQKYMWKNSGFSSCWGKVNNIWNTCMKTWCLFGIRSCWPFIWYSWGQLIPHGSKSNYEANTVNNLKKCWCPDNVCMVQVLENLNCKSLNAPPVQNSMYQMWVAFKSWQKKVFQLKKTNASRVSIERRSTGSVTLSSDRTWRAIKVWRTYLMDWPAAGGPSMTWNKEQLWHDKLLHKHLLVSIWLTSKSTLVPIYQIYLLVYLKFMFFIFLDLQLNIFNPFQFLRGGKDEN